MKGFSEFHLEEFIWNNIEKPDELKRRGLEIPNAVYYRQMKFPTCGIPDIVGVHLFTQLVNGRRLSVADVSILELKKGEVTGNDVLQIFRYISYIHAVGAETINRFFPGLGVTNVCVQGFLIGNYFTREALCALGNSHTTTAVQFDFDLSNGISFSKIKWPEEKINFRIDSNSGLINVDARIVASTSPIVNRFNRINRRRLFVENPN